jgi:hypothetical protein
MKLLKLFALFSLIMFSFEAKLAIRTYMNTERNQAEVKLICGHYTGNQNSNPAVVGADGFYYHVCVNAIENSPDPSDLDDCTSYKIENGNNNVILTYVHTGVTDNDHDFSHLTRLRNFELEESLPFTIACVGKDQVKEHNNDEQKAEVSAKQVARDKN